MYRFWVTELPTKDEAGYPYYDEVVANIPDGWKVWHNTQNGFKGIRLDQADVGCHPSSGQNPGSVTVRPDDEGIAVFGCYGGCTSWEVWQALAGCIGW